MNTEIQITPVTASALASAGVSSFSQIQEAVIPALLEGKDALVQAPTGSGKTYAYLVPILETLQESTASKHLPQALILAPTRELCEQITSVSRNLLANREGVRTFPLTGGIDIQKQIRSFRGGADIVVGTPARVLDHLRRHTLKTKNLRILVIDEADAMLEMGFEEDVRKVISSLQLSQTVLFSATYPARIEVLASDFLHDPFVYRTKTEERHAQHLDVCCVIQDDKKKALLRLLRKQKSQSIVFVNTRAGCDAMTAFLKSCSIQADTVHSEMDYRVRKATMQAFRKGTLQVLVATDVASRGIDIPSVSTIICFDFPDQLKDLVHRAGRTSRSGRTGNVIFLLKQKQKDRSRLIEQELGITPKLL